MGKIADVFLMRPIFIESKNLENLQPLKKTSHENLLVPHHENPTLTIKRA